MATIPVDTSGLWDWWGTSLPHSSTKKVRAVAEAWEQRCYDDRVPRIYVSRRRAKSTYIWMELPCYHMVDPPQVYPLTDWQQDMMRSVALGVIGEERMAVKNKPADMWVAVGRDWGEAWLPYEHVHDVAAAWFTIGDIQTWNKEHEVPEESSLSEFQKRRFVFEPKENLMEREFVKLYKDGNVMGVETNAIDSQAFMRLLSQALSSVVEAGKYQHDWEYQFDQWLPQAFNINARLNGYKTDVQEFRVIRAGHGSFKADEEVYSTPEFPSDAILSAIEETPSTEL